MFKLQRTSENDSYHICIIAAYFLDEISGFHGGEFENDCHQKTGIFSFSRASEQ
jgi:hypothetical protein